MVFEIIGIAVVVGLGIWLTIAGFMWWVHWYGFTNRHDPVPIIFMLVGIALLVLSGHLFPWDFSFVRKT